jgi:Mycotoxin biosynthesis protein UstYa
MLRQLNYREHYHPNMTAKETGNWQVHADHCLELLRAAAMCHADTTSLTTFMWRESEKPMLSMQRPLHQCVDWDELVASTRHRIVSSEELKHLKNPLLHRRV